MTISPLGHVTTYLSVTLARPDSMHTSLHDSPCHLGWLGYFASGTWRVVSVGSQPGEDPPGVDLVLPCSTVVLADALVLLTDGANCSYTIFLAQTLLIRLWPKAQPTINICRGWVKELSLSELTRSDA